MNSFLKEFKEFAVRGNLVDLAVAVVIGGAFGKVVSAFVDGMVMPIIGKLTAGIDFANYKLVIQSEVKQGEAIISPEVAIQFGKFITQVIDFTIVAFVVFVIIKGINALKKKEDEAPVEPTPPPAQEVLLTEIRDLLKNK